MVPAVTYVHPEIRALWSLDMGSDRRGSAKSHAFGISETLYAYGEEIPAAWGFRDPWPVDYRRELLESDDDAEWPDSEYADMLRVGDITGDDLRRAGNVLNRYCRRLVRAGKDY